jgi:single-stranded-DNA-specific exonuclease
VVRELIGPADLEYLVETDGSLPPAEITLAFAEALEHPVWGQGFKSPRFGDAFEIAEQRVIGGKHLKLRLKMPDSTRAFDGILFGRQDPLPNRIFGVYGLQVNEYNAGRSVQLLLEHWQDVSVEPQ